MSDWRIRQRYGFGVGRICLRVEPYRRETPSMRAELADALSLRRTARGLARAGFGLAMALALVIALVRTLAWNDHASDLKIVPFETAKLEPEPAPPAPEPPALRVSEPEPEPEPEPPLAKPSLPEPPPVVARAPLPTPPPKRRPTRPRASPTSKRARVQIDSLARTAEPPPERMPASRVVESTRGAARPQLAMDALELPTDAPASVPRPRRKFAAVTRRPRQAVELDPILGPEAPDPAPPVRDRNARPPRPTARRAQRPTRPLPVPVEPDPVAPSPGSQRSARRARVVPRRDRRSSRTSRGVELPAFAPPASLAEADTAAQRVPRSPALPQPTATRSRSSADGLAAVPLGSLAACVSDREEDRLKQKLLEVVTTQQECLSEAGRYRFVETKNLNAFLMWIERAPSRREADRCVELRLALDCLRREAARGAQ